MGSLHPNPSVRQDVARPIAHSWTCKVEWVPSCWRLMLSRMCTGTSSNKTGSVSARKRSPCCVRTDYVSIYDTNQGMNVDSVSRVYKSCALYKLPPHQSTKHGRKIKGSPHSWCLSLGCRPCTDFTCKGCNWFSCSVLHTVLSESLVTEEIWRMPIIRLSCPVSNVIPWNASSTEDTRIRHESARFSQITTQSFEHASLRFSSIRVSRLMYNRCSEKVPI